MRKSHHGKDTFFFFHSSLRFCVAITTFAGCSVQRDSRQDTKIRASSPIIFSVEEQSCSYGTVLAVGQT
jgi:hypothetical protein